MKRSIFILSCVLLSACSQIDGTLSDESGHSFRCSVVASIPTFVSDDVESRASLSYVIRLNWNAGDEISVINATTRKVLGGSLTADSAGSTTTFSGTLTGSVKAGDKLVFLYPSQGYTSEQSFKTINIDFSSQVGSSPETVPYVGSATAVATSSTFSSFALNFTYQMAFFQLNIADLPAGKSIDFLKLDGFDDNLRLTLGSSNFVSAHSTVSPSIILNPSTTVMSSGGKTLFFTVPPQLSVSTNRSVTASVEGVEYTIPFGKSSAAAGSAYRAYALNFGGYDDGTDDAVEPAPSKETETYPGGEFGE